MAVGSLSLQDNTTGSSNVAVGVSSLANNISGLNNVAGSGSLSQTTGNNNTGFGITQGLRIPLDLAIHSLGQMLTLLQVVYLMQQPLVQMLRLGRATRLY